MGGSEQVTEAAQIYFFIRIWAAPCALANFAVLGWLIGLARAGTALALQVFINLGNIALTVWLVLGLGLGIAGAGIAAAVAETAGLAAGLAVAWRILGGGKGLSAAAVLDRAKLLRMLAVNRDIMIRTAALIAAFAYFTAQGARAGDVTLAANAVLHNFTLIGSFFLDGMATAAEQICGHSVGARNRAAFVRATRLVLAWGFGFGIALSAVFLVGGTALIDLITTSETVRAAAREFMLYAALAPAMGVGAYIYDGIYIGATWARAMRNLMLLALAIYLAAWWSMSGLGNAGLWLAILMFLAVRCALQAAAYPFLLRTTFARA
jgi:MATE family multidrug resistance protein